MYESGRLPLKNPRSLFHPSELHVIIPYSNHLRYQSRHRLFIECVEHMLNSGVTLYVVELAHGHRPYVLQLPLGVHHIKLRTSDVMWHKECQINVGLKHAVANGARYLAWIDGDIQFANPYWATETIEALQSFAVVQPWRHAIDLDHRRNVVADERNNLFAESFCSVWQHQLEAGYGYDLKIIKPEGSTHTTSRRTFGHFGYAWACTANAYREMGGLLDWVITGAADYFMSLAFAGLLSSSVIDMDETAQPGYRRRLLEFQERCNRAVNCNISYVSGTVLHGWHGQKIKRGYLTRPRILKVSKFDPDLDLILDDQGLYRFARENHSLRDGLLSYFSSREEDQLSS